MGKIRVLILDDHTILREGITRLLGTERDVAVKGASGSVGEALFLLAAEAPDVVVLDLDLGAERGTDFLIQARRNGFHGPIIVLTAAISEGDRELLHEHGVERIVNKDASIEQLAGEIRQAVGRAVATTGQTAALAAGAAAEGATLFTGREARVLRLVVEGFSNKLIAGELDSTEPVIKFVLQQLFRKTGARTRAQLVRLALEQYRGAW